MLRWLSYWYCNDIPPKRLALLTKGENKVGTTSRAGDPLAPRTVSTIPSSMGQIATLEGSRSIGADVSSSTERTPVSNQISVDATARHYTRWSRQAGPGPVVQEKSGEPTVFARQWSNIELVGGSKLVYVSRRIPAGCGKALVRLVIYLAR